MTKGKSLSSQATWFFSGKVFSYLIILFIPIVLVRIFSKSDYGTYAQFLLIYMFFFRILRFGFNQALFYFLPKHEEYKRYYIFNTYLFLLVLGVLNFLALAIFQTEIAGFFNSPDLGNLLPYCGVYILLMLVASPLESLFIIDTKAEIAATITIASEIVRGTMVLLFGLLFKSIEFVIYGLLAFAILRFLLYTYVVFRSYRIKLNSQALTCFKKQFKYAMPMGVSGIIGTTGKRIDKFVLSMFFSPDIFAVYSVGSFNVPFINMFFQSVGEVVLPKGVKHVAKDNVDKFVELWQKLIIRFSFVGVGSFFALQLIAEDLITLVYTDQYLESVPVFRIIIFVILEQMLAYAIVLKSYGRTNKILQSNFIAFLVSISMVYFMVKYFGLIGAAITAVAVFYTNATLQLFFSIKTLKRKFIKVYPIFTILKLMAIGAITCVGLYFVTTTLIDYKVLRIVISLIAFFLLYVFLSYGLKVFNIFQEELFIKLLTRIKSLWRR